MQRRPASFYAAAAVVAGVDDAKREVEAAHSDGVLRLDGVAIISARDANRCSHLRPY